LLSRFVAYTLPFLTSYVQYPFIGIATMIVLTSICMAKEKEITYSTYCKEDLKKIYEMDFMK
jgi:hypothetical protein